MTLPDFLSTAALFLGVYAFAQSMMSTPTRKTGRKPNGGKHG